ncbi:hypothetical protein JOJ87_001424 [Rhodococcus ruber]|uniref:phage tail protein n=1 Tax=Rhodococcus ruber TaxID=1830 RepID=UPI001AE417D5|nr:phage tail protein [Rhodococcus ruber]MBP2211080.1 hypothetical protein [Rhodococcus ruber]
MSVLSNPELTLIEWEGHNGEWFTLAGVGSGDRGVHLSSQISGIWDDPFNSIWNSHAFQIGADFGGIRTNQRDVVFGVHVKGTASASWRENDSEFRKSFSPLRDSKLWIETPDSRRHLNLRLSETPQFAPEIDPNKIKYGAVVYTCVAGNPRWYEPDVTSTWVSPTDTTAVDGSGNFTTTSSGTVAVSNPTDTTIWLKWVLQAYPGAIYTLPDFSFGDDRFERAEIDATRSIVMPPLMADEHLVVDTDEHALNGQVNSSLDTQVYIRMNGVQFLYPIPPYTKTTHLPVSVTGAPAGVGVQCVQQRPWSRPFGLQ